jgi:hypothetical protein
LGLRGKCGGGETFVGAEVVDRTGREGMDGVRGRLELMSCSDETDSPSQRFDHFIMIIKFNIFLHSFDVLLLFFSY